MFESTRDGNYELYVMDTDGNNLVNLTNNPGKDFGGKFSQDGTNQQEHSDSSDARFPFREIQNVLRFSILRSP